MTMHSIDRFCPIRPEQLDEEFYFQSLLQEAALNGLLTPNDVERIQLQILLLLADRVRRFTGGNSDSVPESTAQSLLSSVFYIIGCALQKTGATADAVEALRRQALFTLYANGKRAVQSMLRAAGHLLLLVQNSTLSIRNHAYQQTIFSAIPPFFRAYDIDFAAHEIPADLIDYPLCTDIRGAGVTYIKQYLEALLLENRFCGLFCVTEIEGILAGYDEGYPDLLLNLFEHVLTNAMGRVLCGQSVGALSLTDADRARLRRLFLNKSTNSLPPCLQAACTQLFQACAISSQALRQYVTAAVWKLLPRWMAAAQNDSLDAVFVTPKTDKKEGIQIISGPGMEDARFRLLAEELASCRLLSDKLALLRREVSSFHDLADLLESGAFAREEYPALFAALTEPELVLLRSRLPSLPEEKEKEWENAFRRYLQTVDATRREQMETAAQRVILR